MESCFPRSDYSLTANREGTQHPLSTFKVMGFDRNTFGLYNSGTYYPFVCDIASISQAVQAIVETTTVHGFEIGNTVQFFIPQEYGMRQLNGLKGIVLTIPQEDQIEVNIDTSNFNPFVLPLVVIDPAQVAGVGDVNYGNLSPGGQPILPMTVPGAFLNQRQG